MAKRLFKIILTCITFCFISHPMEKTKSLAIPIEDKAAEIKKLEEAQIISDIEKFMNLEKNDIKLFLDWLDHNTDLSLDQLPEIFKRLPLHIAASHGTPHLCALAMQAFPDQLDSRDNYENSALHYASRWGTPENISCLIEHGFNKEASDRNGLTPLHVAAGLGSSDNISRLIALGCNKDASNKYGGTPLHFAAAKGIPENISRLIALGCNKEAADKNGATPLHSAAGEGTPDNIAQLIALGCNKEATNKNGATPLHSAAGEGTPGNIACLITLGCNKETTDANGQTPLHYAAGYGTPANISCLITLGCNKESSDKEGANSLHLAAGNGTPANISCLINLGFNKEASDQYRAKPLHFAAAYGTADNISCLIKLGCYKNATNESGATALHYAAGFGTPDNISRLIECGCNKEAITESRATPLHFAAQHGTPDNISRLIKVGCNKNAPDKNGETPLDYASRSSHPENATQLIALDAKQKLIITKTEYTLDELSEINEMDSLLNLEQLKIVDLSITQIMRSNTIESLEKLATIIEIFQRRCSRLKNTLEDDAKKVKKDKNKKKELDKDIKKIENLIDTAKRSIASNRSRIKSLQDAKRTEEKMQLKKAKELQKKLAKQEAKKTSSPSTIENSTDVSNGRDSSTTSTSATEISQRELTTKREDLLLPHNELKIPSKETHEFIAPRMNPIHFPKERSQSPKIKKRHSQLFLQVEHDSNEQFTNSDRSATSSETKWKKKRQNSNSPHHSEYSSEKSQHTPESSQDRTPRSPTLKKGHSQFFSIPEAESPAPLTSSARPLLVRTISLANFNSTPHIASYKRLSRQLSSSDLRKITDVKFTESDITKTLEQLQKDGLIQYRNEDNKISATKLGDHTVALTIHTHTTKNKEWTQNPLIIRDFLNFVRSVNQDLYDAIKGE